MEGVWRLPLSTRCAKPFAYSLQCVVCPGTYAGPVTVHRAAGVARKRCAHACYFRAVNERPSLDELSRRIEQAFRDSPVPDFGKNLRAMLAAWLDRMDLVLREDFEVQRNLLERAQARLAELEARVAELETRTPGERPQ